MIKTLTYVLLGKDALSPVAKKAGKETEGAFAGMSRGAGDFAHAAGLASIGVAAGLGIVAGESVKAATGFQSAMEKIHTQAGASQASVNKLTQEVLKLGPSAEQSPTELANALYHLKSVGLDDAHAMIALKTSSDLAAVGGANLEETTNALAGAWRSGVKGAESFGKTAATVNAIIGAGNMRMEDFTAAIGTGILPAAKTFGVSLQSVGAALALMTDEGVPADEGATRLRMTLSLLGAPSSVAERWLAKIGVTGLDLANKMRGPSGLVGAISLLKEHLDKSGLSASRQAELLSHAFGGGRSSSAILTLVNNLEVLKKKQEQINGTIGKYGDAVTSQRRTAQAQFALLRSAIETLAIRIGTALLPPLVRFTRFLNASVVPVVMKFATHIGDVFKSGGFRTIMADINDHILPKFYQLLVTAGTGVAAITKFIVGLPGPVKIAGLAIIAFGIAMRIAAAANPWLLLATAIILIVGIIVRNFGKIKAFGELAFNSVKAVAMIAWNWIKQHWPLLLAVLTGPIGAAVIFIVRNWSKVVDVARWVTDNVRKSFDQMELAVLLAIKGLIHGMAVALGWVPFGIGSSLRKADAAVGGWVSSVQKRLDSLNGKTVTIGAQFKNVPGGKFTGPGYAGGTSGASRGWAWVGEKGPELAYFHGGETVIPNHVASGYATGTGLAKMGINFHGAAMSIVDKVLNSGIKKLAVTWSKTFLASMAMGGGSSIGGAGVRRWLPLVLMALAMLHQDSSWAPTVLRRMNQESGGNPRAINLWDSNAAMGDPSRGLMQTIMGTFLRYRSFALPNDIYNPLANIFAGLNYALQTYGSLGALNRPGGYAKGTKSARRGWAWVGEGGVPELVHFNGGEQVGPVLGSRGATIVKHYHIDIAPTPLARPADIGREVVTVIQAFEQGNGKRWRS